MLPAATQPTGTNASYLGAGISVGVTNSEIQVMMVTPILAVMSKAVCHSNAPVSARGNLIQ